MTEYRVLDGERTLAFAGELLADTTTDDGKRLRWTEVRIYRHEDGRYIVEKQGRSCVFHRLGEECTSGVRRSVEAITDETWINLEACPKCCPDERDATELVFETNRNTAHVVRDAEAVVEFGYIEDRQGVRFMPDVVRRALRAASEQDDKIRDAYTLERI